jgi:dihydrofolate reductase
VQISVFIATSLDGFIAREDGGLDWLPQGSEEDHGYNDFFASVDTLLMGRKTFEVVLGFTPYPYSSKRVVVCSRTLKQERLPKELQNQVEVRSQDVITVVQSLKTAGTKHLYADGGQIITALLEANLIDQLILTRVPVLLGRGIRLFGQLSHDVQLSHIKTESYASGLVQSHYIKPGGVHA